MLSTAKFPVILSGAGVVIGGAIPDCMALAERLDAPVCSGYQHNDSFPGSHPMAAGPLGYNGSKAGMQLIAQADVVLALGTRLNPSQPSRLRHRLLAKGCEDHPGRHQPRPHGLTKPVTVGICGDAKQVAQSIWPSSHPRQATPTAKSARQSFTRPSPLGPRSSPAWTTKKTIPARSGTPKLGSATPTACHPVRLGAPFRRAYQRKRSSRLTSATTAPSATPTPPSRKVEVPGTGLFGPCGYGFLRSCAKIGNPDTPSSASPATALGISMNEMSSCGRGMARHHHGHLSQLPVGRRETQYNPLV